jgi:hypothetical protein
MVKQSAADRPVRDQRADLPESAAAAFAEGRAQLRPYREPTPKRVDWAYRPTRTRA